MATSTKLKVHRKVNLKESEKVKYMPLDIEQILSVDEIKEISEKHNVEINEDEINQIQDFYENIIEAVFINYQFSKQEQGKLIEIKNEEESNFIHPCEYRRAS